MSLLLTGAGAGAEGTGRLATGLSLAGAAYVSAPDSAALSVANDIDVRAKVALTDWTPATENVLCAKWNATGDGYLLTMPSGASSGKLQFAVKTAAGVEYVQSNATLGLTDGSTKWVRGTRIKATGVYALYTSDDGSSWNAIAGTVVSGTTNAITDGSQVATIGSNSTPANYMAGTLYRAIILSGINTNVVGDFDATLVTRLTATTPTTYADAYSNTWTVNGSGWSWL